MQKKIDILASVVDNYGDMGFPLACIDAWRYEFGDIVDFTLWTDAPETMRIFAEQVGFSNIPIAPLDTLGQAYPVEVGISLLGAPLPEVGQLASRSLIIHLDYLSFDRQWIKNNEHRHIRSVPDHEIIELVQSPLQGGAGLISPHSPSLSRRALADRYGIDVDTEWISLFVYQDTLARMDWQSFPETSQVLVFGGMREEPKKSVRHFSLLPMEDFYAFLQFSDFSIIRGDVTGARMLQSKKSYYWDIYREIGGVHRELSDGFLEYIHANSLYRTVHDSINLVHDLPLSYADLKEGLKNQSFDFQEPANLMESIKKHVDRFYFSI